jgi:uncharacterized membrane protein (DUF4010 family)
MIALALFLSAAFNAWFGEKGLLVAAAIAGFAGAHSAAVSVASLVSANKIAVREAALPIVAGLTTNTISKMVFAYVAGGRRFAAQLVPALVLMIAATWTGVALAYMR